jgi:MoaA/NifB/PqqE/SkfB family radical SAM enzyme
MPSTVEFKRQAANVFLHVLTRCNLRCRHCYINPEQHGRRRLPLARIERWLEILALRSPGANLVLLGGEPTLHPELPQAVRCARRLGYASVTVDTNGYLFHDILARVTPAEVDVFSFSLDGATAAVNDRVRGEGSYATCVDGIRRARAKGFRTSLIFTVSRANIDELERMGALLTGLGVERLFIQVLGLRGQAAADAAGPDPGTLRVPRAEWQARVPAAAQAIAAAGVHVVYPRVFLDSGEPFECAGRVADNYFVFPNGRVYRCPLCEDYPVHSLEFRGDRLVETAGLNERDFFRLNVAEGCVMNALIQPFGPERVGCCLLKQDLLPG